ncbi:MAG TPA: heparinase II/III family protein [Anaerolineales bacterium]|nr:heparinase II/III family protein [Anaerolineales bacterium]
MPRLSTSLKALLQLGIEPVALNAFYRFGLWTGYYRRVEKKELRSAPTVAGFHPLFPLPSREPILQTLGPDGRGALTEEADQIVKGKFRMFGGEPVPIQLTFTEPLQHWADYETGKFRMPGPQRAGHDMKFIWEPARFDWAVTLGRAYHVTQDEQYAEAFWKYFEAFSDGNPPYLGPHWMNGQEVAIRLMNFVWAAHVFQAASVSTPERCGRLLRAISQHAARIPATLVYARSQNNNHLVTESAALFTAGLMFDRPGWRELGWFWLNRALRTQISSYGEYIQHSTNYHRLMLQTVLWVDMILRERHQRWPALTLETLIRASHWMFSMIDPASGRTPNLGANDGALILPLSSTPFHDFRPTVQGAARAFLRTGLPAGVWDETSLWLGLPASKHTTGSDAYMTDHLRGKDSWAYLRASRFKSRLSHMDQLHFDLWWRGLNVAQDAGTYLYNAEPPWDNPLVSTRLHNTVTVDSRDQMTRGGRFLTLDWFPAYSKSLLETDVRILGRVLAYHKGYLRLGIRHERLATVFTDGHWEIKDKLVFTRPGSHVLRMQWLLMDGEWEMDDRGPGTEIRVKSKYGWITLNVSLEPSDLPLATSLVRAGELIHGQREAQPYEGWSSPTYGTKVPALSLAVAVTSSKSVSFKSEFLWPKE